MEDCIIRAHDGHELAAIRFTPQDGRARALVVIASAMGVKQDFYIPFAEFLAQQGYAVLSFDYRGMGRSRRAEHRSSLRGLEADITTWATQDYNAALHHAREWQPNVPTFIVGHSLGGQLPGMLAEVRHVDGIMTVAAGSGYWRLNAPQLKRTVWFLWYFLVPTLVPLFGYFPGKRLGMVGDLPAGVIGQWSRWCRNPHYVSDDQGQPIHAGYDDIRIPILSLSFTDDEMMSQAGIASMHARYRHAQVERRHLTPAAARAKRVGHFGFFRDEHRDGLWSEALAWLDKQAAARAQKAA